jgi:hypothetical protein
MMKQIFQYTLLMVFLLICSLNLSAQEEEIEKKVQVVKAYKPQIGNAYKISELPEITDTTQTDVRFDYYLLPKRIETEFDVNPIPAATMVGEPLTELYGNYLKIGMGTKLSPQIEAYLMNKRSHKHTYGAYFQHNSSAGKVAMANDERNFAGYSDNHLKVFGKKFFEHSVLSADASLKSNTRYFYGYNTQIDTSFEKSDIKQNFLRLGFSADYKSTYVDSSHLNYDIDFDYSFIEDNYDTRENRFKLSGELDKYYENNIIGLNTGFTYLDQSSPLDTVSNSIYRFNPWIGKFGKEWRIQGGVNFIAEVADGNTTARFYPVARMEYDIIDHYIIPYAGIDGKVGLNSYQEITKNNPFVTPGLNVKNTNYKMIFYAGLKGNLSSSTFYNMKIKYSFFDDMHFFTRNILATDSSANQFNVAYYQGEVMNIFGEISFDISESLSLRAQGNLYQYTFYDNDEQGIQPRPWHKPGYDLTITGAYNLRDKIILQTDVYFSGKRWVQNIETDDARQLDGFVDANIGLEYRYSKVLSGYLKFRNILANNYYQWNNYPVYGLQAFLGITYAF